MNTIFRLIAAVAAGAAVMYYLDPATGRRRRALVRDKGVAVRHGARDYARVKSRRATNRVRGALARTRAKVSHRPVEDDQLHDRIRARLGHLVDRPSAVDVHVEDGHVVMAGSALPDEIDELTDAVSAMRGVASVETRLTARSREETAQDAQRHVRGNDGRQKRDSGSGPAMDAERSRISHP